MSSRTPRVGIERKILTSILVVGILPMVVAITFGYVAARKIQSGSVRQTLLTTVSKTVEGLRALTQERFREVTRLAADPSLPAALATMQRSGQPDANLLRRLEAWSESVPGVYCAVAIYGRDGRRLLTSDPSLPDDDLDEEDRSAEATPRHIRYRVRTGSGGTSLVSAMIATPIFSDSDGSLVGFLAIDSALDDLLAYAMGSASVSAGEPHAANRFQIVYLGDDGTNVTAQFRQGENDTPGSVDLSFAPNPEILSALETRNTSGTLLLKGFDPFGDGTPIDAMVAYHATASFMSDEGRVFLVVYRSVVDVYTTLNWTALVALICGMLFIAFLCVNAYRDVHNNIVRPVSLLNEGAQIVRHGDFDLKLKIGTGDEIEELATSFNKMAAALKKNIHQLGESEERYRSLITSMRDGIFQTNTEGYVTFMNPAGLSILGFPTLKGATETDFGILFEETLSFDPAADSFNETEAAERSRLWMKTFDGRRICVEISRGPDFDSRGTPAGVEGTFRDVTENVRLEKEARERAERISAINQIANVINSSLEAGRLYESLVAELLRLVECDYVAVALLSDDNRVFEGRQLWPDEEVAPGYTFTLDANHSCAGWVAREREMLQVDDLLDGPSPFVREFPESVRSCVCLPLYATGRIIGTLNLGCDAPSAFSTEDIDGLRRMAPHLAVAIRNAQLLVNLQLSLEEVTRAREKLHEANDELKTLDEMKTNLLSNVSHELRTPLVAVMGYCDMILNEKAGSINDTQREYLEITLRNVEKLVTLIENLLDFSRLRRGDDHLASDTFDLADCAGASVQSVQPFADGRKISLDLLIPDEPVMVDGEKGKMGQVFNNLLHNAIKFNADGGKVTTELHVGSGWVEVCITDTGIGMPQEACEKIFTRFYQYDGSSTRKYGGTGIGLSIAQDIVRLHGGTISVTSEETKGSTFRFRLNLTDVRPFVTEAASVDPPEPDDTNLLVQIVTDDRPLSIQLRTLLASEGMDVIHASSLDSAVTLSGKYHPDCILVDLHNTEQAVPLLDGLLAHSELGALPIVILTDEDALHAKYRSLVSARVKRSFRKSSLLGGIHHALGQGLSVGEPVGTKVLCVDDDPEVLDFIGRCLESEGLTVTRCDNGLEAIELAATRDYGLVLLDIAMPGMDGWETCRRIRDNASIARARIYMVTAKPMEDKLDKIRACGADGFLQKPFHAEDLLELARGLELGQVAK